MASTELTYSARRDQDAFELGKVFKESGMFPTVKKEAEAVVKILAGREFGLGPLAAMQGIHMVDGKPTLSANLIAGQIKRHPAYDYEVLRREADGCALEFFAIRNGQRHTMSRDAKGAPAPGTPSITWEKKDATAAGLLGKQNWKKYPRDMFFARCLTAGARTFCPDVLGGSPIYTAEELGDDNAPAPEVVAEVETITPTAADVETPYEKGSHDNAAKAALDAATEEAKETLDAEEVIDAEHVDHLREKCKARGYTADKVRWTLLSIEGVDNVNDIAATMKTLTQAQALAFEAELDKDGES